MLLTSSSLFLLFIILASLDVASACFQACCFSKPLVHRCHLPATTFFRTTMDSALPSSQQSPESGSGDEEDDILRKQRLEQLGFSVPTSSSSPSSQQDEPIKVRVDLIKDVDPVTLTAVGFSLLAINFLVLANMGDVGIAGIVARIINSSQ